MVLTVIFFLMEHFQSHPIITVAVYVVTYLLLLSSFVHV